MAISQNINNNNKMQKLYLSYSVHHQIKNSARVSDDDPTPRMSIQRTNRLPPWGHNKPKNSTKRFSPTIFNLPPAVPRPSHSTRTRQQIRKGAPRVTAHALHNTTDHLSKTKQTTYLANASYRQTSENLLIVATQIVVFHSRDVIFVLFLKISFFLFLLFLKELSFNLLFSSKLIFFKYFFYVKNKIQQHLIKYQ